MVNVSIPTAAMITCDGDQFPVGIRLEALSLQYQQGTANHNNIQLWNFALKRLLNKPYENEVTLTGQNTPLNCLNFLQLFRGV